MSREANEETEKEQEGSNRGIETMCVRAPQLDAAHRLPQSEYITRYHASNNSVVIESTATERILGMQWNMISDKL